mmetsp:Transcript_22443/g.34293  ORF Transcript_22443/g.34293 Transcript_22443/m.34293 type:complete len:189 (+) Transcript_22443:3-569(+)
MLRKKTPFLTCVWEKEGRKQILAQKQIAMNILLLTCLVAFAQHVQGFAPSVKMATHGKRTFVLFGTENKEEIAAVEDKEEVIFEEVNDMELGVKYVGSVDWDAEWKRAMEKRSTQEQEKSPPKILEQSPVDAAKKALSNLPQPSLPNLSIRSMQGDWKFWVGVLLVFSVGLSLLSGTQIYNNDVSYYI